MQSCTSLKSHSNSRYETPRQNRDDQAYSSELKVHSVNNEKIVAISRWDRVRSSLSKRALRLSISSPERQLKCQKCNITELKENCIQVRDFAEEYQISSQALRLSEVGNLQDMKSNLYWGGQTQSPQSYGNAPIQRRQSESKGKEVESQSQPQSYREATISCDCISWEAKCKRKPGEKPPCSGPSNWVELLRAEVPRHFVQATSFIPISDLEAICGRKKPSKITVENPERVSKLKNFKVWFLAGLENGNWFDEKTALWGRDWGRVKPEEGVEKMARRLDEEIVRAGLSREISDNAVAERKRSKRPLGGAKARNSIIYGDKDCGK